MSTGTALAQITEPAHRAVAGLGAGGVNAIVPQTFDDVFRFSQVLARSGLCPHGMDTAEKVSVAILTGLEIGVKPMQAVQGIAVIGGRPCIWGDLALGIVRGANTLEYIKETFEGDEAACDWSAVKPSGAMLQFKAVCRVKRKGEPEVVTEFSVGDAVVAKLWGKRGYNGKDTPWITNPKRMLKMRARGFGLRDTHADVLKGLYIAEEMIGVEEDRPQIAGPAAPPPPPPAIESRTDEPAPPANTKAVPAAPPAEKVEEAEIVEAPTGQNLPQEETELLVEAGVLSSEQTQHPPLALEEPLDPEAWLAEVKDRFDEARTPADVDGVNEVFGDTANELGMTERQRYQDMHEAAVLRTAAQGKPEQAEQTGEPGPAPDQAEAEGGAPDDEDDIPSADQPAAQTAPDPGDAYYRRITDAVADSARTYDSVAGLWKATKPERDALIADGSLSRERMKEMQASIKARYAKEYGDPAPQTTAAAPASPGPTAPPAEESDLAKMDREFRAQVAACSTMEEIGNLVANTMVARNKFSGTPEHKAWTALVAQRRKQISGVA